MGSTQKSLKATPWHHRIDWGRFSVLVMFPFLGLVSVIWVPLHWKTLLLSMLYTIAGGVCITAGYHRLWSHRAFVATAPLKLLLATLGAGAMQGSVRWWAREHRVHHRYTDTAEDPHSIKKGFLHAHILWLIVKQPKRTLRIDISDLEYDPIVAWQEKYYFPLAILMGWVAPAVIAGMFWDDLHGGFLYGGILRIFFSHQATFCVNSVAHYIGDQPYDDRLSPRNSVLLSLITFGEGFHNFHHEFPSDYRNGVERYQVDITKWCIWIWGKLGLAHDLKRFRQNEIDKASFQQLQKQLNQTEKELYWGPAIDELPVVEWQDFQEDVKKGGKLVCVEGVVHDVADFIEEHPGGFRLLGSYIGKDGSAAFNGGIYNHSKSARNLLATLRVAVLRGGCEVESMKAR